MTSIILPPGVLQAVLEQLAESVLITDKEGRILYVNAAFEQLTGYRREEVIGQTPRLLKSGHHPPEFYRTLWNEVLSGRAFRGVFVNRRKDGSLYTEEKIVTPVQDPSGKVVYLVATSRDVTEEMALRAQLEELATHDPLTGLLNRRAFQAQVEKDLLRSGAPRALAYLDLDRFKAVNDALGHGAGDQVLVALGRRLQEALPEAVVGRLGGDEFAAWYPAAHALEAREKGKRLLQAVALEIGVNGQPIRLEASLGLALFPAHGASFTELLRRADLAMYRAKSFRLPHPEVFTPDLEGLTPQALALEAEFHRAFSEGRAVLFLQGILRLREGKIQDAEVLFRIRGPEGFFNPLPQMDLSRRTVNEALDRFVLGQVREFQARYPGLTFWVNLTPWSLSDAGFIAFAERQVHQGLDPQRVVVELNEHMALTQIGRIGSSLWRLRSMGFSLALDDFGTGQTSLAHLQGLPMRYLKVGRELLRRKRKTADTVLRHLAEMAHDLGLELVLEGVETPEDLELARSVGADMVQGFYLHVPEASPRFP